MLGAVGAAEDLVAGLDAMTDDAAMAMLTLRREGVDGALKGVERMLATIGGANDKGAIVVVSANFA